jgi:chromosome partitioning protein
MEGLGQLMQTIRLVQEELNPRLEISGILLTMFDGRNNICHQVSDEIRSHFGNKVLRSVVPRNVRLSEAPSYGQPALMYDIASRGAQAYLEVAQEVLAGGRHG